MIGIIGPLDKARVAPAHGYDHVLDYRDEALASRIAGVKSGLEYVFVLDSAGNIFVEQPVRDQDLVHGFRVIMPRPVGGGGARHRRTHGST